MDIKLDTPQLRELLAQAVLASLDEVKRDMLIKGAIEFLVTKDTSGGYGYNRKSPIEDAFNYAVRDVAQKTANDMLTNDSGLQEKLRELVNEALVRLMETNREKTVEKIADAIAAGMAYRERG